MQLPTPSSHPFHTTPYGNFQKKNTLIISVREYFQLEYAEEFEKHEKTKFYGQRYDFGSIMHYRQRSGFSTLDYLIIPVDSKYKDTLGSKMISFTDITMINRHYNCAEKCKSASPDQCKNGGYPHPRNCSRCLCPSGYGGIDCNERPSDGCGLELEATETWQNLTIDIQNEDSNKYLDGYKKCNYWIKVIILIS
ncbi:hypothetical protein Y032_0273g980 [Ancylostoma ceylanicum]|uniref:Peptidase M12A domain-containing protein n=1 Tax=Ancylostoma ceylanicum TaxID=53326 RepID=A0A016S7X8_9BILA|nr:hypothetical protein Y032_0273g980 [Ancylostoma ceylanicum]